MSTDLAQLTMTQVEADLAAAERELRSCQLRVQALRRLKLDLPQVFPEAFPTAGKSVETVPHPLASRPKGRAAVVEILRESPGAWLTVQEVRRTLRYHGWEPAGDDSEGAVRAALRRASEDGVLQRRAVDGRTFAYSWTP